MTQFLNGRTNRGTHYRERTRQGHKAQEVEQRLANPGPVGVLLRKFAQIRG